jgi:hypothetical protein
MQPEAHNFKSWAKFAPRSLSATQANNLHVVLCVAQERLSEKGMCMASRSACCAVHACGQEFLKCSSCASVFPHLLLWRMRLGA